jgi:hypothetical protein
MRTKNLLALSIASLLVLASCKKDDSHDDHDHNTTTPAPTEGSLKLKFDNRYGNAALVLNSTNYVNNNDTFKVSKFNYYVTNIKLTAVDNSVYTETESYHLIKADDVASLTFDLTKIPVKNYKSITFMIGVDSTRNVSGAQTGALDPAQGHFWTWNSGYIMAKLEGTSPQSNDINKKIMFHIGGFKGTNNVLKMVTLNFPTEAVVNGTKTSEVLFKADLQEWFAPNTISFATNSVIHMPGMMANNIAANYANMFSVVSVTN